MQVHHLALDVYDKWAGCDEQEKASVITGITKKWNAVVTDKNDPNYKKGDILTIVKEATQNEWVRLAIGLFSLKIHQLITRWLNPTQQEQEKSRYIED